MYLDRVWSEVEQSDKGKLCQAVTNSLIANNMNVPKEKDIVKRIKGFYMNRRSAKLTKCDDDKKKKRKMDLKRNQLTFVR